MDKDKKQRNINRMKIIHFFPARVIAIGFAGLILLGAVLLYLPISVKSGQEPDSFIDALFTFTSAVCVTGLIVTGTNTTWSVFGKIVIIILVQSGGLGIMSIATIVLLFLGRRIGLKERLAIQESLNNFP